MYIVNCYWPNKMLDNDEIFYHHICIYIINITIVIQLIYVTMFTYIYILLNNNIKSM